MKWGLAFPEEEQDGAVSEMDAGQELLPDFATV